MLGTLKYLYENRSETATPLPAETEVPANEDGGPHGHRTPLN